MNALSAKSENFLDAIRTARSEMASLEKACNLAALHVPKEERVLFAREIDPEALFPDQLAGGGLSRSDKAVSILYDTLATLKKWMEEHAPVSV